MRDVIVQEWGQKTTGNSPHFDLWCFMIIQNHVSVVNMFTSDPMRFTLAIALMTSWVTGSHVKDN